MIYRITIQPEAKDELAFAYDWYEKEREGLGERLLLEVREYLDRIAQNPYLYQLDPLSPDYRRAVLRIFPYIILYSVQEQDIVVARIRHGQRSRERL
jgi:plasmid stabilization system protein ParE